MDSQEGCTFGVDTPPTLTPPPLPGLCHRQDQPLSQGCACQLLFYMTWKLLVSTREQEMAL